MGNPAVQITVVIVSYWIISITTTFANKFLLGTSFSVDLSVFIAWYQCLVTAIAAYCIAVFRSRSASNLDMYPKFNKDTIFSKSMLMLGFNFAMVLTLNNLCLKYVGVAFFLIARALTIVFTVLLNYLILKRTTSLKAIACCILVGCGFFLGLDEEFQLGTLSTLGVIFGVASSFVIGLNGVLQKSGLERVTDDTILFSLYENMNATAFFFIPLLLTGQWWTVFTAPRAATISFWICLTATGLLGFLMSWIVALQMKLTSPLTSNISNNSKAVIQTVLAVFVEGKVKPTLWWCSNLLVITGAACYTYVKNQEQKAAAGGVAGSGVPPPTNKEYKIVQFKDELEEHVEEKKRTIPGKTNGSPVFGKKINNGGQVQLA